MNSRTYGFRTTTKRKMHMLTALLLLFFATGSYGAMGGVDRPSASTLGENAAANQNEKANQDQRYLTQFRAAPLSLIEAIAIAERLHAGSQTVAVAFDVSGGPAYRVRTVKNQEIWENVINVLTGRAMDPEITWSLNELDVEERDNIGALRSVSQGLSEAVAIAEKAAAGKAISGGLVKESDQVNFVVLVLSDDRLKEVYLEAPCSPSKRRPTTARRN